MINKYKDFFSAETLGLIDQKVESLFNKEEEKPLFSSSISHWEKNLTDGSVPILRYVLQNEDVELSQIIRKEIEQKIPYYVNGILIHICPRLSFIPWHDDGLHTAALTVYLNKKWNPNWGGYFMYSENDGEIKAIFPERNLGILQKGGVLHSVSGITMNAGYRISIQCFLKLERKFI